MKLMIIKLHSCGVNYQNDYISDCLEKNYELTNNFDEADTIVMLGGCCIKIFTFLTLSIN